MNFTRTYKAIIILTLITTSGILFSVDSQKSVKTSGVPENLTISQNGDSMTIVWNRVESATGYKIYGMLVSTRYCGHKVKHIFPRTLQGLSFLSKSAS
jgi:hypothetical protein